METDIRHGHVLYNDDEIMIPATGWTGMKMHGSTSGTFYNSGSFSPRGGLIRHGMNVRQQ